MGTTTMSPMFHDRHDAGRRLALRLEHLSGKNTLVLGLPRGGVPVAFEVAKTLHAPLDVLIVRKLGVPWHPELAFGAVGEGGVRVLNDDVIRSVGLHDNVVAETEARERHEVAARTARFRPEGFRIPLRGRTAVIVDDGIATGASAIAACSVARLQGAKHVVLAVPSAPSDWVKEHSEVADEVVVYDTHLDLGSVGAYYEHFEQVDDETVEHLLREAREATFSGDVRIPASESEWMDGHLEVPFGARGMVVFSHGSGSSRLSPRNQQVAERLNAAGFATLLFDLLVPEEARVAGNRFDIELLSRRLGATVPWVRSNKFTKELPIGFFGASTGAAAAIVTAARNKGEIRAVVSRGGRPDLAGSYLKDLQTPTLFVVGGADTKVLELNREAISQLNGQYSLSVVHGASHLFEEPGAMESVMDEAVEYFAEHLA
jgi:putative phosphoribosyl transferase